MSLVGLALGLGLAFSVSRLVASVLYETSAVDPARAPAVVLVLLAAAALANLMPAWRAGRVDPMKTVTAGLAASASPRPGSRLRRAEPVPGGMVK
ncbi:MAG: hypothetical protein DWQ36_21695 [Acidobacteria bacterium]|nr:MAG: hypothetical protein DWQ30_09355 [Acidobacteriota bacterium]REK01118.1 MAG: hypothetical protein DWQ36_21695 [Acidobacteriota bacterium]